jgi:CheY-like chemotaxis protein
MLAHKRCESRPIATVLLIEDDATSRRLLRRLLEGVGFTVLVADDGRRGVDLYRSEHPDVVLTELLMPEQDGIETLLAIRREAPAAQVIAMSGHQSGLDYLHLARQLGATAVLGKPFSPLRSCCGDRPVPRRKSGGGPALLSGRTT